MSTNNREIESKFYIQDLAKLETRLKALGARLITPRSFEYNLRFDDAEKSLRRNHKVLRLRQFSDTRLTFKGPGQIIEGALARTEIEMVVNDFENAKVFLESLGYQVSMIYEKYRTEYKLDGAVIALDELPYGHFVEIEAESSQAVNALVRKLALKPHAAIPTSYQGLFERVKQVKKLETRDLTFEAFSGIAVSIADLNIEPADEQKLPSN